MNIIKQFQCFLLSILLLLMCPFCLFVSAAETNAGYEQLLALGFSEEFLNTCTEEMRQKILSYADGREVVFSSSSSADGNVQGNAQDLYATDIPTDFLNCISQDMKTKIASYIGGHEILDISYTEDTETCDDIVVKTVNIVLKDSSTEKITGECISIYWEWKKNKPLIRQEDKLEITWSNSKNFIYSGSFYAEDYQIDEGNVSVGNTYTSPAYIYSTNALVPGEMKSWTDLKYFGGQSGGCLTFLLIPKSAIYDLSDAKNEIQFEYTHYCRATVLIVILLVVIVIGLLVIIKVCSKKTNKKQKA